MGFRRNNFSWKPRDLLCSCYHLLLWEDSQVFQSQMGDEIPPACPSHASRSLPSGPCMKFLPWVSALSTRWCVCLSLGEPQDKFLIAFAATSHVHLFLNEWMNDCSGIIWHLTVVFGRLRIIISLHATVKYIWDGLFQLMGYSNQWRPAHVCMSYWPRMGLFSPHTSMLLPIQ